MVSLVKPLYTTRATATGGRSGRSTTSDGLLDVPLAAPPEMGGPGGATNPEQLFATGYAACFQSALGVVGRRQKVDTSASLVSVDVTIGTVEGGGFGLAAAISATIPGVSDETARELVEAAHQVCPYSAATRGNIDVTLTGTGG
ncbi:MAG TPA: organic hydroperoxide resistance protein [Mycobacteriales bacterium]|nr:organic hydroperoxide resistance protein [Mycobacteriales bacterium]